MAYCTLTLNSEDYVTTLTLNRPEKRNAISREMIEELNRALEEIELSPARAVILAGAGAAFSAGMDLNYLREFPSMSKADIWADARRIAGLFRRVWSYPKILIAAVHGPAIAGGTGLATLADFTLASPEARFGYTEVRIGFMPAIVASFLVRQIGEKRARNLLLSGRLIGVEEAFQLGLVGEIVPAERLRARAKELAEELAALSPLALVHTKRLIVSFSERELDHQLEQAIAASAEMRGTSDFREGVSAFLEKRKPVWTGE
ncbi:MAG: enoyl-CoA hydratase [Acidobacteria bacterium]|nr:MAG: enoyl-CoA hydratase [Acidobacteriota bacterium]